MFSDQAKASYISPYLDIRYHMSNLKDFIDYKSNCPICNSLLNLSFFFKSKSKINIQNNELVIDVPFTGFPLSKNKYSYTAQYHINPITNKFYVHFLDKNYQQYNYLYFSIKDKYFIFLESQINSIKFYKECTVCRKYNYSSTSVDLDHKNCIINNLSIMTEYFCLSSKTNDEDFVKVYKFFNNYKDNSAIIMSGIVSTFYYEKMGGFNIKEASLSDMIEIPISIDISNLNIEELINKLKLYLILS